MRLQRAKTLAGKTKTYYRWQITVAPDAIEELEWSEGDELDWSIQAIENSDGEKVRAFCVFRTRRLERE